ncbi:hypothetical protein VP01_4427g1 [Puccinia sorghi]|uniref:DNA helicase n=1 Tax=Puccinia sorghi TaxID=27349 RepID=A0A0L6UPI0_9BASI|nr:hypothetical protein VP01_4427g1 [Puccinia sorghi]
MQFLHFDCGQAQTSIKKLKKSAFNELGQIILTSSKFLIKIIMLACSAGSTEFRNCKLRSQTIDSLLPNILKQIDFPGFPAYTINLQVRMPIILLLNLNKEEGLSNRI